MGFVSPKMYYFKYQNAFQMSIFWGLDHPGIIERKLKSIFDLSYLPMLVSLSFLDG